MPAIRKIQPTVFVVMTLPFQGIMPVRSSSMALPGSALDYALDGAEHHAPVLFRMPARLFRGVVVLGERQAGPIPRMRKLDGDRVVRGRDIGLARQRAVVRVLQDVLGLTPQDLALVLVGLPLPHAAPGDVAARLP